MAPPNLEATVTDVVLRSVVTRHCLKKKFVVTPLREPHECVAAPCGLLHPDAQSCTNWRQCVEKRITISRYERLHRFVHEAATEESQIAGGFRFSVALQH